MACVVVAVGGNTQSELLKEIMGQKIQIEEVDGNVSMKGLGVWSFNHASFDFEGSINPEAKAVPKIIRTPHPNSHGVTVSSNQITPMQLAKTGIR